MDNGQLLPLLGGVVAGGGLGAGGIYAWFFGRMKRDARQRQQAEQARQMAAQQLTQARKQVEQLQRDNHQLRLVVRPAPRPNPPAEAPVDDAQARRRYAESLLQPTAPVDKPSAFQDTEVMPHDE
jgi:hypothetical protein